jgi:alcohol dehydrogenase, propanol-preferring
MKALRLPHLCDLRQNHTPLELADVPIPVPKDNELLVKVSVCGVCHTELDEIEGRTPPPQFPIILGHQVIGRVEQTGKQVTHTQIGDRVGVAWIYSACGRCKFCLSGQENLCPEFKATGRDVNGGYAEYMTVQEDFAYPIPERFSDAEAAPLLCAGAIGYRSLRLTDMQDGQTLGLTGFGASAHLVLKLTRYVYPNSRIFVFARSAAEQAFASELGAAWVGATADNPPELLDAMIDTTPVWTPVMAALKNLAPGGRLVINAIRKEMVDQSALLGICYPTHIWLEKEIKSVANVTRQDVREFLHIAAEIPIIPEVQEFAMDEANTALLELKERKIRGAKVLRVE